MQVQFPINSDDTFFKLAQPICPQRFDLIIFRDTVVEGNIQF